MGEYIRKGNTEIKIGVCEHLWVTRSELLALRDAGFRGYYGGEYTHEIERHLESALTLYAFRPHDLDLATLLREDLYKLNKPAYSVSFPLEFAERVEHERFYASAGKFRTTNYLLPCAYLIKAHAFLNEANRPGYFSAHIIGERYSNGCGRTVLGCSSCGKYFNICPGELDFVNERMRGFIKAFENIPSSACFNSQQSS